MENKATVTMKYVHTRANGLYAALHALIAQLRPGTALPSEYALAHKYQVSRRTVHKVLRQLEEDGLVIRRQGVGSFVNGKRTVTVLLPCPDYMTEEYQPRNDGFLLGFQGAMRAAQELGFSLEALPVSASNNRDFNFSSIDYERLSSIGSDSMIVCSAYFCTLYQLFLSRRARVAVMGAQYEHYGYRELRHDFYSVDADLRGALRMILDYCRVKGRKRIALVKCDVAEKKYPLNDAYSKWCAEHGMPEIFRSFPEEDYQSEVFSRGIISAMHRETGFDALIFQHNGFLNVSGTIQEVLELPSEMPVFGVDFQRAYSPGLAPFPCCMPNAFQLGYEAVRILAEAPRHGATRTFPYLFYDLPGDWRECLGKAAGQPAAAISHGAGRRAGSGRQPLAFHRKPRRKTEKNPSRQMFVKP